MNQTTCLQGIIILVAGLIAAPALAADVGFGVNVNIGNMPPAPVYAPAPAYVPAPVVIEAPPMFIAPPSLGVSIAVGVPYDMFLVSGNYYVYRGNNWYYGPRYSGPWRSVTYQKLPHQLRRHDIEHYRHVRDREYRAYNQDRDHYRGRYYQAKNEGRGRNQEHGRKGGQDAWSDGGKDMRSGGRGEGRHDGGGGEGRGESRGGRHGQGD